MERVGGNNPQGLYLALRWAALAGGLTVALAVLARQGAGLPWPEIGLLAAVRTALLFRTVVMRRGPDGAPLIFHTPGESLLTVGLLRHGPAEALMVGLISGVAYQTYCWRDVGENPLRKISNTFYLPALSWVGGCLYEALGGRRVLAPADSALFYQNPAAILLPLLAMLAFTNEVVHRTYMALVLRARDGVPFRQTWLDPMFSCFDYVESVCGAVLVVQWTAWGWGTVPFTVLLNESLLLSARAYFERLDARREAESDPLTGLASWRGIENFLDRRVAAARRGRTSFAVLFLDADGLKAVNDRQGHAAGDELLGLLGECCRAHARKRDLVGRRGGDEFLLVLDGLGRAEAEAVRARLQAAVADALAAHPRFAGAAGVSIGLAVFPQDGADKDALIGAADRHMYADKQARRRARADAALEAC